MSVFFLPASLVAQWSRILLQCRRCKRQGFHPWVGKIPWRRAWQPTAEFLPGESHGQRSLAGYSQQSRTESDMTEGVTCFSFACFLLAEPMTSLTFFSFQSCHHQLLSSGAIPHCSGLLDVYLCLPSTKSLLQFYHLIIVWGKR